jgi:hypothetical protein
MATKTRPPDFSLVLRVAKAELRSPQVQEVIVEGALQLLAEHLNQWAYSPGFPELAHVPSRDLRRFCKSTQVLYPPGPTVRPTHLPPTHIHYSYYALRTSYSEP